MTLNHHMLRYPYAITAGFETIRFADDTVPTNTSDQTLATGTAYVAKGETGTGSPTDIVTAFQTAANAAYGSFPFYTGVITIALGTDGRLLLSHDGVDPDPYIRWTDGATTFDGRLLGFDTSTDFQITSTPTKAPYQVFGAWYPGIDAVVVTAEIPRRVRRMRRAKSGRITYIKHGSGPFYDRMLEWDYIPSARIFAYRIADAAYAAFAGVVQSDPNAYLVLLEDYALNELGVYLNSGITFPEPGSVYVYNTNDPATHTEEGPYQLILDETFPSGAFGSGFPLDGAQQGMSAEHYRVPIKLRKE